MATAPTPKDAIERVKARLAAVRKRRDERPVDGPAANSTVTWPRDLNASGEIVANNWGTDPVESM